MVLGLLRSWLRRLRDVLRGMLRLSPPRLRAPPDKQTLVVLHFNDVYNIQGLDEEGKLRGGAAPFASKVKEYAAENPLLLFSGDCLNPSDMSIITQGRQMAPVLNRLGIQAATIGNHEFDFGMDAFEELIQESSFPWILSNIRDHDTGKPIGGCRENLIINWAGVRVGLLGLAEKNWYSKLTTVDTDYWKFTDMCQEATKQAATLRAQGAQLVVALTHMKLARDLKLAANVPELDLILGGHDHEYLTQSTQPHGTLLVKSGKEFEWLTVVRITLSGGDARPVVTWEKVDITDAIKPDEGMAVVVDAWLSTMKGSKIYEVIGYCSETLDGTRAANRTRETNLGNWVADVWRVQTGADVALLNSGSLKIDEVLPPGPITLATIMKFFVKTDDTCVLEVPGQNLLAALENSVSAWPAEDSRFCQVSGVHFDFDGSKPAGQRISPAFVRVGGQPLDLQKLYSVACKCFLADGRQGFSSLKGCQVLSDEEESPSLPTLVRNTCKQLGVLNQMVSQSNDLATPQKKFKAKAAKWLKKYAELEKRPRIDLTASRIAVPDPARREYVVAPVLDGRIRCLTKS